MFEFASADPKSALLRMFKYEYKSTTIRALTKPMSV